MLSETPAWMQPDKTGLIPANEKGLEQKAQAPENNQPTTNLTSNGTYSQALALYNLGFFVLPCDATGKITRVKYKDEFLDKGARPDPQQLRDWWDQYGHASPFHVNLDGTVFPDGTRPWLLDLDSMAAAQWCADRDITSTRRAKTNKGFHLWFRCKGDYPREIGIDTGDADVKIDVIAGGIAALAPFGGRTWMAQGDWHDLPLVEPTDLFPGMKGGKGKVVQFKVPDGGGLVDLSGVSTGHKIKTGLKEGDYRNNEMYSNIGYWIKEGLSERALYQTAHAVNAANAEPLDHDTVESMVSREWAQYGTAAAPREIEPDAKSALTGDLPTLAELADVGGVIGEMIAYTKVVSQYYHPEFALMASLATAGALLGHRVKSPTGLRTNVLTMAIGRSGSGKDAPRAAMGRVLSASGLGRFEGPSLFHSPSSVRTALEDGPIISFLDEFGGQLASAKVKSSTQFGVIRTITEAFTSAGREWKAAGYADREVGKTKKAIKNPHLCLYATTSPTQLWDNLSTDDFSDGFAARFMIVDIGSAPMACQHDASTDTPPPSDLLKAVSILANLGCDASEDEVVTGDNDLAAVAKEVSVPDAVLLPFTPEAEEYRRQFVNRINAERDAMAKSNPSADALLGRVGENAVKVAMIRAISDNVDLTPVSLEQMVWASQVAERIAIDTIKLLRSSIGKTEFDKDVRRVHAFVRAAGEAGVTKSQITNMLGRSVTKEERQSILDFLTDPETGFVEMRRIPGTGGASRTEYVATKPLA